MIIDFHTHIFPKKIREKRENFFKGETAFKLLYESPKSKLEGYSDIIAMMDEEGVDISVIFGFPWKDAGKFKMNNDYIIEAVKKHPNRLKGFVCFDAENKDSLKEAERCIENGLCGIGELAFYEAGIGEKEIHALKPIIDFAKYKNIPTLIHTNEPVGHEYPGKTPITLLQIYNLLKKFPENKIILAHWGGGIFFFDLCKKEVSDILKNVYFDTAASPFLYKTRIYKTAADIIGADKILFGSDYPLLKPSRYIKEIENSGISSEEKDKILFKNAAGLLS